VIKKLGGVHRREDRILFGRVSGSLERRFTTETQRHRVTAVRFLDLG